MKKLLSITFFAFILLFLACKEEAPTLGQGPNDPNTGMQAKQVLIEEFTAVRCVNCPSASQTIQALQSTHGERLIAVSIHAGFLSVPYEEESQQAFATDAGAALLTLLEEPDGFPSGVVDRKRFEGEPSLQLFQNTWAGYIANQLEEPALVAVDIRPTYNASNRTVDIDVALSAQLAIDEPDLRLTVYITENDIVDAQLSPNGILTDYVHKHVFRDVLTSVSGDIIEEDLSVGSTVTKTFSYSLPDLWQTENCHIVAFVHKGGESLEVLQAQEVKILE